ncbi:4-coumarate--CoA ligase 5-like [Amphibalanus amphitrite]|uniref:4-coumarate--CoA ligase 5-like n=1 Tax=Amphibalanus amphitrite TaxID=1232801 RepID=UPI001C9195B7|nr:4-coumarate--CoA ligase 5-like [Amphibalanus amphitrite]XP_043196184.1 4-coumarate--CoA ligase 5-like [Amphibalanus amphitrite]XP_043196185.1 4-coumarate--CoA ligase 5-like [Amphibalanus amphitrite]XP_043196186.1 4-coumarate--CoA ligase 5-like [Amphibalanus amphitrite]
MRSLSLCRRLSTASVRQGVFRSHAEDIPLADRPIFEMIWGRRHRWENRTAYVCGVTEKSLTYNETYRNVLRFSDALDKRGYKHGDVVAACLPNCVEMPVTVHGCAARGITTTTLNPLYTEDDIVRQLEISDAQAVVAHPLLLPTVRAAAARVPTVREVIVTGQDSAPEGVSSFEELLRQGREHTPTVDIDMEKDPVLLLFSSGTTGLPKGVIQTNYCLGSNLLQATSEDFAWEVPGEERFLGVLPTFHTFGMFLYVFKSLLTGASTTLLPRFEPEMFVNALTKYRPTALHLVPPLVTFLANSPTVTAETLSSLKVIFCGAAPLGPALIQRVLQKIDTATFIEGYGMTESSPVVSFSSISKGSRYGSCGVLLPNTELKVIAVDDGRVLDLGESGEICVRGPQVMPGYYKNPEATAATIDQDGWLHTGDVGYCDKDGFLFIVDRVKELIKYKGFQVAPAMLEDMLRKHAGVADAAVIGVPDEEAGELPRAYVVTSDPAITEQELADFVNAKVNTYYQLRGGVHIIDAIPKNASGKTMRRDLRERAIRELEEASAAQTTA